MNIGIEARKVETISQIIFVNLAEVLVAAGRYKLRDMN